MGVDLAVMGDKEPVGDDDEVVSYSEPSRGIYKKLIVRNDRLVGAIVLGDGAVVPSLLQTFASGMPLAENRADVLFLPAAPCAEGPRGRGNARRTPHASATATTSRKRKSSKRSRAARAASRPSAISRAHRPAADRAGRKWKPSSRSHARGIEQTNAPEDFVTVVTASPAAARAGL